MKFHCDRCKTRYSIADERVRGKILKIRCKNCSSVITVREGMDEPAPVEARAKRPSAGPVAAAAPQASALRSAFDAEMRRPAAPSASDSFAAPASFDEEWYVSIDGNQDGPFSLAEAQAWVADRDADDELYCWSDGFDDWRPVDQVVQFRGLRARPGRAATAPPPPPAPGLAPHTPGGPAYRRAPTPPPIPPPGAPGGRGTVNGRNGTAPGVEPPSSRPGMFADLDDDGPADDDLNLDIGEASRVVKLADLFAPGAARGQAVKDGTGDATGPMARVERLGKGSGSTQALPAVGARSVAPLPLSDDALAGANPDILQEPPRRSNSLLPLLIGGGALTALVLGVVVYLASTSGDGGGDPRIGRGLNSDRLEELAYRFDNPNQVGPRVTGAEPTDEPGTEPPKTQVKRPTTTGKTTTGTTTTTTTAGTGTGIKRATSGTPGLEPLTPADVIRVSHSQSLGTKRCYERALKLDPFLTIKRLKVKLTVAPSGVVSNVQLSAHENSDLGQCIKALVRKWPFPASTEGITTEISVVFEQG